MSDVDGTWLGATDAELMTAADAAAFGVLYDRHVTAILRYLHRRTDSAETAADLCAETFAAAFVHRRRFRDTGTWARPWLYAAGTARPARWRRYGGAVLVAAVATGALAVGAVGVDRLRADHDGGRDRLVAGAASPDPTSTGGDEGGGGRRGGGAGERPPAGAVWSIESPPEWNRADSELLPEVSPPSLTLATSPLTSEGEGPCPSIPTVSLRDLGARDALVSVVFFGPKAASFGTAWPRSGFDDAVFPAGGDDLGDCDIPAGVEVHHGSWRRDGGGLGVLVAFGADVPGTRRAEAWTTLSSLHPEQGEPGARPVCVVTRPVEPGLSVPDRWPAHPATGLWYGTRDLWTALPTEGSPTPRKSVWWSTRFLGGSAEALPRISVTWRRLDTSAAVVEAGPNGTNASSADGGSFMIAGIDPVTAGCWSEVAAYRGIRLGYVYWNPAGVWAPPRAADPDEGSDGALVEGTVAYDAVRNCIALRDADGPWRAVVWPGRTTVADDGSLHLADGTRIRMGDKVQGGGGEQPVEAVVRYAPQACMPGSISGDVFVIAGDLRVVG